jgi:hypothetical protein
MVSGVEYLSPAPSMGDPSAPVTRTGLLHLTHGNLCLNTNSEFIIAPVQPESTRKVPSHWRFLPCSVTQWRMALINSRLPCFGRGAVFSCLGGGASADSPSAFLFVEHMLVVGSSTFEAFRHLDRAQRLAGIRQWVVWYMLVYDGNCVAYFLCFLADTYAPARFGAIPLLSVPDRTFHSHLNTLTENHRRASQLRAETNRTQKSKKRESLLSTP